MPISGLIITTDHANPQAAEEARLALAKHPAVTPGPSRGHRHVVVLDSADSIEDKQIWQWINDLPGVVFVDVVYVDFHPADASTTPSTAAR